MTSLAPYYQNEQFGITIYRADNTEVLLELPGIGALITDPPYSSGGAFRTDRMRSTVDKYVQTGTLAYRPEFDGDNRDQRSYLAWMSLWMSAVYRAADVGATFAVFTDWRQLPTMSDAVQAGGWTWRGVGVWDKTTVVRPTMGGMQSQCEYILWGTKGRHEREANKVYLPGVMSEPSPRGKTKVHMTEKPVNVMEWCCQLAKPGAVILDPFMGSGSTLVAAVRLGRPAIGIGVSEEFCKIAVERVGRETRAKAWAVSR